MSSSTTFGNISSYTPSFLDGNVKSQLKYTKPGGFEDGNKNDEKSKWQKD